MSSVHGTFGAAWVKREKGGLELILLMHLHPMGMSVFLFKIHDSGLRVNLSVSVYVLTV